jgi:hypothetical protein
MSTGLQSMCSVFICLRRCNSSIMLTKSSSSGSCGLLSATDTSKWAPVYSTLSQRPKCGYIFPALIPCFADHEHSPWLYIAYSIAQLNQWECRIQLGYTVKCRLGGFSLQLVQYLLHARALTVDQGNNFEVCICQADFENNCIGHHCSNLW